MKSKETMTQKLLKRLLGINGVFDEYREQEANRIGANVFAWLWWYLMLSNMIAFMVAIKYPVITLWTLLSVHTIVFAFIIPAYLLLAVSDRKLDEYEVTEEEEPKVKRRMKKKAVLSAVLFMSLFVIQDIVDIMIFDGKWQDLVSLPRVIGLFIGGCFFGGVMYSLVLVNLRKAPKE
ncbi:DUF3278 domain-containing protein [Vagococcus sp.]|uniref:DUF3278 domain-containing protein n=1 Tax=Vagococcus sp. TaxID=1933889 RepID=UPI003F97F546